MRSRWMAGGLLAILLVALVGVGSLTRATAQEDEHEEEERSALAGGWIVTTPDVEGAPPALYTFTAEGNLLQTGPRGVATGVWEAEGDEGAAFTIIFFALDAQGRYIKETVNGTLTLTDGGDAFVAIYQTTGVDPDGADTFTSQGTAQGERIVVGGTTTDGPDDATAEADADADAASDDVDPDSEVDADQQVEEPGEGTPETE